MQSVPRLTLSAAVVLAVASSAALAAPAVTVSPAGNHPQSTTQVSGSGFGASEPVDIYFDTTDEALAIADASGNFDPHTITVPADTLPGTHWVSAVGRRTAGEGQHVFRVRTNWPSLGFNPRGQRFNPYENVISAANVGTLQLDWTAATGAQIEVSSPAVAQITSTYNPYIFVTSIDGSVHAYDSTGARVWKTLTGGNVTSSPAVSGTTVYVGSGDGKLYAFDAKNGAPAWPSPATTGGAIESSPTVANGLVYIGSDDWRLYAFHASDGTLAWKWTDIWGPIGQATPAVADGVVYIGSTDKKMHALDAATGAAVWPAPFSTNGVITSSPAVARGVVYFGSEDRNIYAVNAKNGWLKWAVTTGNEVTSSAAAANGDVYVGSLDGKLYALRGSDGAILWTGTLEAGANYSSAAVANGVVYIGGGSNIEAFNAGGCGAATCSPLWTATTGGAISSPTISDGRLYVGSDDHKLYAFALNGGNNPAYAYRKNTQPPSRASLHPDMRLKPARH